MRVAATTRRARCWSATSGALTTSVFDDPDGRKSDDWGKINIRGSARGTLCIPSFERAVDAGRYYQNYARGNGLDGKVSRVSIRY